MCHYLSLLPGGSTFGLILISRTLHISPHTYWHRRSFLLQRLHCVLWGRALHTSDNGEFWFYFDCLFSLEDYVIHCGLMMPYGNIQLSHHYQVMVWCLIPPSHFMNRCELIISKVLSYSYEDIITRTSEDTNQWNKIEKCIFKITSRSSRDQWVKILFTTFYRMYIDLKCWENLTEYRIPYPLHDFVSTNWFAILHFGN